MKKEKENSEGDFKSDLFERKEYIIRIMVINMKEIGKMVNLKEKEEIIIIEVLNMKVIGKIENLKEKEYILIVMMINMKVNIL